MIEIATFSLLDGVAIDGFLAADTHLQTTFAYRQPGLVRRTTARSEDGTWLVLTLWTSADNADRAAVAATSDPAVSAFEAYLDPSTVRIERFSPVG